MAYQAKGKEKKCKWHNFKHTQFQLTISQGVKKPYNPVLGEFYRCKYNYSDGTEGYYVAEQVSHHPPISAYYYASPENGIVIAGDIRPKSRFLGNSAATLMQGSSHIIFTNRHNERYDIVMPNMYARGICKWSCA